MTARSARSAQSANSAIVVGAGIGGIATAIHLAQQGMQVTVLEKNQRPGGRCDRFTRDGHTFDTGPTLLVMPLVYESEFAALGISLRNALDLQRVDPTYHLVFDDGSQLALTSDLKAMYEQLEAIEPGSFDGFLRYLHEGQQHYTLAMKHLVQRDFRTAGDLFNLGNLPLLFQLKPLVHHYQHMDSFFTTPRLKATFTFQDVYMGLSPFEAPATFSMMPYTELAHGVWYPRGGMYRIVEVLMKRAQQLGIKFLFETSVKQIAVNGTSAWGVVTDEDHYLDADVVIANADLPYAYQELLPDAEAGEQLSHKRFSCSVISFFWGIDKTYEALPPHTLFLADEYQNNFERIERHQSLPEKPSLYIHAPTRLDPTLAPPGEDTIIAIVPVSHIDETTKQHWAEICDQARQAVFQRLALLGITDLQDHIKFEVSYTPLSWRKRYNLMKGATHGLSHTLNQLAYFRPANQHPRYQNLFFVGASTHPGTGIPTALVSAHLVANRVVEGRL